jgi:ABC-2 type transport system permease protein/sodium transport system permease protein
MSQAISSPSPPAAGFSLARIARLARKELRETLRDRRTIITLVLMPLLVYPVLGLALNTFLVSSTTQPKQLPLRIATKSQEEWRTLMMLLAQGEKLIEEHQTTAASAPLTGGPILGADLGASDLPLSDNEIFPLRPDIEITLEDLIRRNEIDLGVRFSPAEGSARSRGESQFQLIYRPDMPLSRQAASFVQRRLEAVNQYDMQKRLADAGDANPPKSAWRLVPIADEKGHSFWLGTLVPLVLILMTITGAVYPAIDLTAGERERGTLEALMAAPVPRLGVLIAKYVAVVTVAMLTAVINLTAMTVTVASSGLWTFFFGNQGSPAEAILAVLLLLILFSMFFAAVLLLVTSFARSFKEAQAYVVPLMVVCLAPGFMSVMPGLELNWLMSVVPLANIVLLARDVLEGDAPLLWGTVAVVSTVLYGGLALALAARVFGSDAILYGSEGSWGDLFRRPRELKHQPTITDAITGLAIVMPLFIIASGLLGLLGDAGLGARLMAGAGISLLIFVVLPLGLARGQGIELHDGFQLRRARVGIYIGAVILGATLWPLAYDLIILCRDLGIATLSAERLEEHKSALETLISRLRALHPVTVLLALAVVPAIGEEFFFRGYLLNSLRGRVPKWVAIILIGYIFGLFHASVFGLVAIERVASSTLLGIALGWLCWRTRSVFPGMLLHAVSNSLMLSLMYFTEQLTTWGYDADAQRYLPLPLVLVTTVVALLAVLAIAWQSRQSATAIEPASGAQPASTNPG